MNWTLLFALHWPHDRLALGWEIMRPDKEFSYYTIKLYLLILTIELDTGSNEL